MKRGTKLSLLALLIVSLSRTSSFCQGGPPLIIDDPEAPGNGNDCSTLYGESMVSYD
jgi:hypothetical protein